MINEISLFSTKFNFFKNLVSNQLNNLINFREEKKNLLLLRMNLKKKNIFKFNKII